VWVNHHIGQGISEMRSREVALVLYATLAAPVQGFQVGSV